MERAAGKHPAKRKKRKILKLVILVTVVLLLLAAAFVVWYKRNQNRNRPYDSFEIVWTDARNKNAAIRYMPYNDGFMRVSRDGAEAVNSYGSLAWNISYDMNEPIAACCREYAAVGDYDHRMLYMMDGTGALYWKQVPYPIREVEVSSVGVTAVRMNDGMTDYIQLVTLAGEVLVEIKTLENRDGFPLDIAFSEDGSKLVTSYLVLDDDTKAGGWVAFYNFGEVGQNYSNNLTGVFKYDEAVPELRFMDNDTLCAFRKQGADIFTVPELPERIAQLDFPDPMLRACTSEKYLAVMTDNTKGGTVARACVFDKRGQMVFDRTILEDFDAFLLSGEDIVLYHSQACLMMKLDGTLKFNGLPGERSIREIMPTDSGDKLMIFDEEAITTIRLIHTKED